MYQAIAGMKALWEQQQTIASNISRSNVAGHRAMDVAFEVKTETATPLQATAQASLPVSIVPYVNFNQGAIQPSGSSTNLAIQGDAFFMVRDKEGATSFTRNGAFSPSVDGSLVLNDGVSLLLEGGGLLQVPKDQDFTVSPDGRAFAGQTELGKIAIASFNNPAQDLEPMGNGRFALKEGAQAKFGMPEDGKLAQGFLETSNSEPIQQMIQMMEAMRVYEANQKMVNTHDAITGRLIETVGA